MPPGKGRKSTAARQREAVKGGRPLPAKSLTREELLDPTYLDTGNAAAEDSDDEMLIDGPEEATELAVGQSVPKERVNQVILSVPMSSETRKP
jgi:hypothetical protein